MKSKLAVIQSENTDIVEAIKEYFQNKEIEIEYFNNLEAVEEKFDLIVLTGFESDTVVPKHNSAKIIKIHPTLLPSFAEENALEKSFTSGIKVGGITIHQVTQNTTYGKIIAQYPVLIGLTTHFEEYKQELIAVAKKMYPIVINSILEDKVFDFSDLFKTSCNGHCGSCNGHCSH